MLNKPASTLLGGNHILVICGGRKTTPFRKKFPNARLARESWKTDGTNQTLWHSGGKMQIQVSEPLQGDFPYLRLTLGQSWAILSISGSSSSLGMHVCLKNLVIPPPLPFPSLFQSEISRGRSKKRLNGWEAEFLGKSRRAVEEWKKTRREMRRVQWAKGVYSDEQVTVSKLHNIQRQMTSKLWALVFWFGNKVSQCLLHRVMRNLNKTWQYLANLSYSEMSADSRSFLEHCTNVYACLQA